MIPAQPTVYKSVTNFVDAVKAYVKQRRIRMLLLCISVEFDTTKSFPIPKFESTGIKPLRIWLCSDVGRNTPIEVSDVFDHEFVITFRATKTRQINHRLSTMWLDILMEMKEYNGICYYPTSTSSYNPAPRSLKKKPPAQPEPTPQPSQNEEQK